MSIGVATPKHKLSGAPSRRARAADDRGEDHRMRGGQISGERFRNGHADDGITSITIPKFHPTDVGRHGADEIVTTPSAGLGHKKASALAIVPDHFRQVAAPYSWSRATHARWLAAGSSWPSIGQRHHRSRQCRHVDRPRDAHPSPRPQTLRSHRHWPSPAGAGAASNPGGAIAGTKPICCSARNSRRDRISNDRDLP